MLIFISWIALSFIVASAVGKHRQIGYGSTLLICLIFSPLIGLLIAGFSPAVGREEKQGGHQPKWIAHYKEAQKLYGIGKLNEALIQYKAALYELNQTYNGIPTQGTAHQKYREIEGRIYDINSELGSKETLTT